MIEEVRNCFTCKYAIDEGKILCIHDMPPRNYVFVNRDLGQGCEHYEEAEK